MQIGSVQSFGPVKGPQSAQKVPKSYQNDNILNISESTIELELTPNLSDLNTIFWVHRTMSYYKKALILSE